MLDKQQEEKVKKIIPLLKDLSELSKWEIKPNQELHEALTDRERAQEANMDLATHNFKVRWKQIPVSRSDESIKMVRDKILEIVGNDVFLIEIAVDQLNQQAGTLPRFN